MAKHRLSHLSSICLGFLMLLPSVVFMACGGYAGPPGVKPAQPDTVSLNPQSWFILYGQNMPDHPLQSSTGAWSISLPSAPGSIKYLQAPYSASSLPSAVSITFRIDSSPGVIYNGKVDPAAVDPATFHLFLERRGDDFRHEYYRWWACNDGYVLGSKDNSEVTINVPLTADRWTSVGGHHDSAEFAETLQNLGWVGMTFGGANFWGHGVNMLGGTATFTLIDFRVD